MDKSYAVNLSQCMFYEIPGVDLHFASGMEGNVPVNTQCK
jgi:hypothetical protein